MLHSLQKSFAGDTGPHVTKIPQEKRHGQACSWSAKFDLPAKWCSKLRRCVKPGAWFTVLLDIRRANAAQAF